MPRKPDPTREPRQRLPIGTTYAHWPIDGYAEGGYYHTRCPRCGAKVVKGRQSMENTSGCAGCAKRHRGSVSR